MLTADTSENKLKGSRRCSLCSRQKIDLRSWLTELTDSGGSNQSRVEISSVESEEDARWKFMCCKIVKRLFVVPPGEYSNKPSVKSRTHKLFVALPGNMRQYYLQDIFAAKI
jgi:hypothetical protein